MYELVWWWQMPLHFLTAVEHQISLSDSDLSKIGETQNPWHNSKITEVMKPFAVFLIIYVFDCTSRRASKNMFFQRSFVTSTTQRKRRWTKPLCPLRNVATDSKEGGRFRIQDETVISCWRQRVHVLTGVVLTSNIQDQGIVLINIIDNHFFKGYFWSAFKVGPVF